MASIVFFSSSFGLGRSRGGGGKGSSVTGITHMLGF